MVLPYKLRFKARLRPLSASKKEVFVVIKITRGM